METLAHVRPRVMLVCLPTSAGRYTSSYRIPVFIFVMIWIFKIPQYDIFWHPIFFFKRKGRTCITRAALDTPYCAVHHSQQHMCNMYIQYIQQCACRESQPTHSSDWLWSLIDMLHLVWTDTLLESIKSQLVRTLCHSSECVIGLKSNECSTFLVQFTANIKCVNLFIL